MGLADDVRDAIADARTETLDLHVTVTHNAWTGQAYDGAPSYVSLPHEALVELDQREVKTMQGTTDTASHLVTFLEQVPPTMPLAGQNRSNPFDANDTITLPDGSTIPVLAVKGFLDGETEVSYYSQVYLG